jgi:pilus assembly protein Flp/PilA
VVRPAALLDVYLACRLAGIRDRLRDQRGQGMVEYALILVLVSLVVVGALLAVGTQVKTIFNTVVNQLKST